MNPERIADYDLVEYLTAGGMADLYLARNPRHESPVVLKTIQRRYLELTRVVRMFVDEGRIAKALTHPNIVRIFDVGEDRGAYFIAMEYIAGRDLLAIARRGVETGRFLPLHLAVAIVAQIATGLTYAHEQRDERGRPLRVVHCDISPGNVVVSFGGTAKIVDFGIARAAIQLRVEDHTVVGKYNYMAPEQIRGEGLDARADLFSLGVILYELTVGRRLFRGRPEEVKRRILGGEIPKPRDLKPDLPEAIEKIILHALALAPADRYASARDLRADLIEFARQDGNPHGKKEIATYLQELFRAKLRGTGEHKAAGTDRSAFATEEGEENLSLEPALPGIDEIVVDADDPEPPPLVVDPVPMPAAARVASQAVAPTGKQPEPGAAAPEDEAAAILAAPATPTDVAARPTPNESHPEASRAEIVIAIFAIVVAVLLYVLVRS